MMPHRLRCAYRSGVVLPPADDPVRRLWRPHRHQVQRLGVGRAPGCWMPWLVQGRPACLHAPAVRDHCLLHLLASEQCGALAWDACTTAHLPVLAPPAKSSRAGQEATPACPPSLRRYVWQLINCCFTSAYALYLSGVMGESKRRHANLSCRPRECAAWTEAMLDGHAHMHTFRAATVCSNVQWRWRLTRCC